MATGALICGEDGAQIIPARHAQRTLHGTAILKASALIMKVTGAMINGAHGAATMNAQHAVQACHGTATLNQNALK